MTLSEDRSSRRKDGSFLIFKKPDLTSICLVTLLWVGVLIIKVEKMNDRLEDIQFFLKQKM